MTIGSLPMACTEIGTEFSTAVPFTLANATLRGLGSLGLPYNVSSWVGKSFMNFTLTSGFYDNSPYGKAYGYDPSLSIGSVSPTTFRGVPIRYCYSNYAPSSTWTYFTFSTDGALLSQNCFTSLTINGHAYTSAGVYSFTQVSTFTIWTWTSADPGIVAGSYPVIFT